MQPAQRLMNIVKKIGAGGDQAIDQAILDQVDHQPPHPGGHHGAGHAHHDHDAIAQHLFPDLIGDGEVAALEGDALHLFQQRRDALAAIDFEWPGRCRENFVFAHFAPEGLDRLWLFGWNSQQQSGGWTCERGSARQSLVNSQQDGRSKHGGPETSLVADRRLRDVHRADDLIGDQVDLLFLIPASVGIEFNAQRGGKHFGGQVLRRIPPPLLPFLQTNGARKGSQRCSGHWGGRRRQRRQSNDAVRAWSSH